MPVVYLSAEISADDERMLWRFLGSMGRDKVTFNRLLLLNTTVSYSNPHHFGRIYVNQFEI